MNSAVRTADPDRAPPPLALSRKVAAWTLAGIAGLAFLLRLANWPQVFVRGQVRFMESDALYHMRRVFLALAHSMHIPEFDPYMNFPAGFHCNWPPLYDQAIAACAWMVGLGRPSTSVVETVGALVPPVLGALTVALVYRLSRAHFSRAVSLAAAAVFAILPFHVQLSVLGRPDHHVAVVFLAAATWVVALRIPAPRRSRTGAPAFWTGILLSALFLTWLGSLLIAAILALWFGLLMLRHARAPDAARQTAREAVVVFFTAAVALWPAASVTHWTRLGEMRWDALSTFQPLLLAAIAAVFYLLGAALLVRQSRTPEASRPMRTPAGRVWLLLLAVLALSLIAIAAGQVPRLFLKGHEWVFGQDRLFRHVVEAYPLTPASAHENFTRLVFFFPFLLAIMLWKSWRTSRCAGALLLAAAVTVLGPFTLARERFSDLFSIPAALLVVFPLSLVEARFLSRARPGSSTLSAMPSGVVPAAIAVLLAGLFVLWPPLRWNGRYLRNAPRRSAAPLYEMCHWLRDHTVPTAGYRDRHWRTRPDYSIMASWETGNAIVALARRPTVANNFIGWDENRDATLAPYRFLVSDSVAEAEDLLDDYGARYVVVREPVLSGAFDIMLDVLELDRDAYFERTVDAAGRPVIQPRPRLLNTMALRLYLFDGRYLSHFRLVYESSAKVSISGKPVSAVKIFEYANPYRHRRPSLDIGPPPT